jgi:hypothetical protein
MNFAGLLRYFAAHHGRPNLKPKSFTRPFAALTALRAGAGAACEQTADHVGGESGEADPPAESPSKPPAPAPRRSGTDKGAAKQQRTNLPVL